MKRVLLATVAATGLVASGAQAFQADQPRQRQQQRPQYNQQLEKKPNEKSTTVDGWLVTSWNDEFNDKLSIVAVRYGSQGGAGFRCWGGESLNFLLMAKPLTSGQRYDVEFRFDQNDTFESSALALGDNTLEIIAGGTDHAMERFLTEFASAKTLRYRLLVNNLSQTYSVELGGNNANAMAQVMRACKDVRVTNEASDKRA